MKEEQMNLKMLNFIYQNVFPNRRSQIKQLYFDLGF